MYKRWVQEYWSFDNQLQEDVFFFIVFPVLFLLGFSSPLYCVFWSLTFGVLLRFCAGSFCPDVFYRPNLVLPSSRTCFQKYPFFPSLIIQQIILYGEPHLFRRFSIVVRRNKYPSCKVLVSPTDWVPIMT